MLKMFRVCRTSFTLSFCILLHSSVEAKSVVLAFACSFIFPINNRFTITERVYHISWFADWGPKVDVVGFCFLDLASNYEPPEELVKWLEAGEKPIYIGFGSLVSSFTSLLLLRFITFFRQLQFTYVKIQLLHYNRW